MLVHRGEHCYCGLDGGNGFFGTCPCFLCGSIPCSSQRTQTLKTNTHSTISFHCQFNYQLIYIYQYASDQTMLFTLTWHYISIDISSLICHYISVQYCNFCDHNKVLYLKKNVIIGEIRQHCFWTGKFTASLFYTTRWGEIFVYFLSLTNHIPASLKTKHTPAVTTWSVHPYSKRPLHYSISQFQSPHIHEEQVLLLL